MNPAIADQFIRRAQGWTLVLLPACLLLVFTLHFRALSQFLVFQLHYEPAPPGDVVRGLIAAQNHWPLVHDPHIIAYLSLPLIVLAAFGLYALGKEARPVAAIVGFALSIIGAIYLGGLFGMWTAFYRGLGDVDSKYIDGAIATFAAQSAPHGAFLLTTTLSKLAFIGMGLQSLALWGASRVPKWSTAVAAMGCALILVFWDLDNWMLIGSALLLAGFYPLKVRLTTDIPG